MRKAIYHDFGPASPDALFRLHYGGRNIGPNRVAALFNWLASFATAECPTWPIEHKKRKMEP